MVVELEACTICTVAEEETGSQYITDVSSFSLPLFAAIGATAIELIVAFI